MTAAPGPVIAKLPVAHRARMATPPPRREPPQDFAALLAPQHDQHEPAPQRLPNLAGNDPRQNQPAEGDEPQPQIPALPQALLAIHVPPLKAAPATEGPPPLPTAAAPPAPQVPQVPQVPHVPPAPPQPAAAAEPDVKLEWVAAAAPATADVSTPRPPVSVQPQWAEAAPRHDQQPPAMAPAPQASPRHEREPETGDREPPPGDGARQIAPAAPAAAQVVAAAPHDAPQAGAPIRQLAAGLAPAVDHAQRLLKLMAADPPAPPVVKFLQLGLHPQDLGSLRITLRLAGDRLDLTVETETLEAAHSLERDRAQLGALLGEAGLATPVTAIEIRAAGPVAQMPDQSAQWPSMAADGGTSGDFPHEAAPRDSTPAPEPTNTGAPPHGEPARDGIRPVPRRGIYL